MVGWNFARGLAWLALSTFVFSGYNLILAAQDAATCKGPAELEQTIKVHPSARAARELRIATRLQPENPLSHIALGVALSQLDQDDAAIDEFKVALNADPKSVPALDGLAKSLMTQKRHSAAIAYLKDAPPVPMLQNDLAIAYSKNGNVSEAVQVLTS